MNKFLLIFSLLITTCTNPQETEKERIYYDWKRDNIGCLKLRLSILNNEYQSDILTNDLLGVSVSEVYSKLGVPNEVMQESNGELFSYFAAPGIQCMENHSKMTTDVLRLGVKIRDGKVYEVYELLS